MALQNNNEANEAVEFAELIADEESLDDLDLIRLPFKTDHDNNIDYAYRIARPKITYYHIQARMTRIFAKSTERLNLESCQNGYSPNDVIDFYDELPSFGPDFFVSVKGPEKQGSIRRTTRPGSWSINATFHPLNGHNQELLVKYKSSFKPALNPPSFDVLGFLWFWDYLFAQFHNQWMVNSNTPKLEANSWYGLHYVQREKFSDPPAFNPRNEDTSTWGSKHEWVPVRPWTIDMVALSRTCKTFYNLIHPIYQLHYSNFPSRSPRLPMQFWHENTSRRFLTCHQQYLRWTPSLPYEIRHYEKVLPAHEYAPVTLQRGLNNLTALKPEIAFYDRPLQPFPANAPGFDYLQFMLDLVQSMAVYVQKEVSAYEVVVNPQEDYQSMNEFYWACIDQSMTTPVTNAFEVPFYRNLRVKLGNSFNVVVSSPAFMTLISLKRTCKLIYYFVMQNVFTLCMNCNAQYGPTLYHESWKTWYDSTNLITPWCVNCTEHDWQTYIDHAASGGSSECSLDHLMQVKWKTPDIQYREPLRFNLWDDPELKSMQGWITNYSEQTRLKRKREADVEYDLFDRIKRARNNAPLKL